MPRPEAFILTGMFAMVCRSPLFLSELSRRGLHPLVITQAVFRERALRCQADPEHPGRRIREFAFIDGSAHEASILAEVIDAGRRWRDAYQVVGACAVGETL